MRVLIWICILIGYPGVVISQGLNLQLLAEEEYPNYKSALTPKVDVLGRPFLYVASNDLGVTIYSTASSSFNLAATISVAQLGMKPMSVNQVDTILYVCVGSHFNTSDPYGLVTVDVSDPNFPVVLDNFTNASAGSGTGIVEIQGDYAYVGAMPDGVVILNISNPSMITFVSQIIPVISYPHINNTQNLVNARGMAVRDSLLYLCYDAGGFRIINCSDILNPIEIGHYANPVTVTPWNFPRAYNNVVLDDTLAYIAVDYCGIEVVNITDPYNPTLICHYNPHGCPTGQWSDAPIHSNEMKLFPACDLLFVATGKSEMQVIDISNPSNLTLFDSYGSLLDTTGSWGLDVTTSEIYLTYVHVDTILPFPFVPFHSLWSGIKRISYDSPCINNKIELGNSELIKIIPNPACSEISFTKQDEKIDDYIILSVDGKIISRDLYTGKSIVIESLNTGIYYLILNSASKSQSIKFIKE